MAYESTKTGMRTLGAVNRQFKKIKGTGKPVRLPNQTTDDNEQPVPTEAPKPGKALFDLNPTEDQEMIVAAVREFAEERLRPVAAEANESSTPPEGCWRPPPNSAWRSLTFPRVRGNRYRFRCDYQRSDRRGVGVR